MDAPSRQPLATAIGTLKDRAISLCSKINDYAKTSNLPPEERFFRSLVTELRLYGGALFTLQTLAIELEPTVVRSANPTAFLSDSMSLLYLLGEVLDSFDKRFAKSEEAYSLKEAARKYRNRITYVLATTQSYADLALLLSFDIEEDYEEEPEVHPKDLSKWLTILNSPYNNHRPREDYLQRQFVASRLTEFPEYTKAAMSWPWCVEEYWSTVQQQVTALFVMPRSYNFVQWVLEYARETSRATTGVDGRQEPCAVLELTNALCNGSASPLHLAAALALPSLVESLLAGGAHVNQDGWLGTPLYCALVGSDVLAKGRAPEIMDSVFNHCSRPPARRVVIKKLLDAGADCKYQFEGPDGEAGSLAPLAFCCACVVNDHTIFERIVSGGAVFEDFETILSNRDITEYANPSPSTLALLITCVLDSTLSYQSELPWYDDTTNTSIKCFMLDHHLKFADGPGPSRLLNIISASRLHHLVISAILDDEFLYLERLAMHPRFDPNLLTSQQDNSTIAHVAVGDEQLEVVEILLKAGADFTMRDNKGRTPLMLAESETMMSALIKHGVSTTATDDKGRNIWYYAAATNDSLLIDWLLKEDPSKNQNMAAASIKGATPLDKALRYSKQLRTVERSDVSRPAPKAARLLLAGGAKCKNTGPHPPFLMGVEWGGNADLVESLVKAGADPRATNDMGENALHQLNQAATPQLVSLVQKLCEGMPLASNAAAKEECTSDQGGKKRKRASTRAKAGLTPAETILTNTAIVDLNGYYEASAHPSCIGPLSEEAYTLLLTPEQFAYHDAAGRGIWARFCELVVPKFEHFTGWPQDSGLAFFTTSVFTALKCLIKAGALARYEEETGQAAVLCLAKVHHDDRHLVWLPQRLPLAYDLFRQFDSPLMRQFILTQVKYDLLMVTHLHHQKLLEWLINTRVALIRTNVEGHADS
ncbi:putative ankyrin repeat protein [Tolypocladium ophioglossoides CBS 100239]|uniref:Putative ankyrin repeat protein n=1 Tax=Tolypocladium ophioglossoides (strain CBS 100239) TaxID=1163406 RepID=A0A0L0MZJ3_TOLOC|nr:putative ankyrin repeat protein [Tolypocladium ophioglossoides CBS 100239]